MRKLIVMLAALTSFSALAKQVELSCATKAYVCTGSNCRWVITGAPTRTVMQMFKDPNYPNKEAPYELYRASYQSLYDRHLLTLNMEVTTLDDAQLVAIDGTLNAGSVVAETSGLNQLELGLRNNNYGRGFSCTSFRVHN